MNKKWIILFSSVLIGLLGFIASSVRVSSTATTYGLTESELAELLQKYQESKDNPEVCMRLADYFGFVEHDYERKLEFLEAAKARGYQGIDHEINFARQVLRKLAEPDSPDEHE